MRPLALALWLFGCSSYQPRIEVKSSVPVNKRTQAVAMSQCTPGVNGCPGSPMTIRRFEVSSRSHVKEVERQDHTLYFVPVRVGNLEVFLDGEVQRKRVTVLVK